MKRLSLFTSAAFAVLLATAPARAGLLWSYTSSPSSVSVPADPGGTGGVSLQGQTTSVPANGTTDIQLLNLTVFSTASVSNPDMFKTGGQYSVTLTITDTATNTPHTFTFDGKLSTTVDGFSSSSANIQNTFFNNNDPSMPVQSWSQTWNLSNGTSYTVTIGPYSPPGPPTASNAGSIAAHVDVSSPSTQGSSPEPSTMILSGLGVSLLGGAAWRRRRLALRLA